MITVVDLYFNMTEAVMIELTGATETGSQRAYRNTSAFSRRINGKISVRSGDHLGASCVFLPADELHSFFFRLLNMETIA